MKTIVISKFEMRMSQIFHELYGSTTETSDKQHWWKIIQELKLLAQQEEK